MCCATARPVQFRLSELIRVCALMLCIFCVNIPLISGDYKNHFYNISTVRTQDAAQRA